MFKFVMIAAMIASGSAMADGWNCQTVERDLNVKAYNQTQPELGTRNAAILIVSDPAVSAGRKTIATFQAVDGLLTNDGATYTAKVDLRFNNSGRKGELISGTKLGELATAKLYVYFSYDQPVKAGTIVKGGLALDKRDGTRIFRQMECERYLKQ